MLTLRHAAVACLIATCFAVSAPAQEWTRFRGPNGSGVSDCKTIPTKWTDKDYRWKVELPGAGHGSVVAWGDKLFLQSGDDKTADRFVLCLSAADGKMLWSKKYAGTPYRKHQLNSVSPSTPAVDAEQVYVYLGTEEKVQVVALDHGGNEKWAADLGVFKSKHGPGTSPMLHGSLVIVTSDQDNDSFVIALDRKSGQPKWRIERKFQGNGASYGVPCVVERPGEKPQIIFASASNGMTSVDPDTGKVNWEIGNLMPLRVVASLVFADGLVITNCGEGGGGKKYVAVQPGSADGASKPKVAWELTKGIPYVPTTVAYQGHLYFVTDGGTAACLTADKGELKWQDRVVTGGPAAAFFGSPICVNGHIYAITRNGEVVVYKASPEKFELVSVHPLGEASFATPAVSGGRMYLRTTKHLVCIGERAIN